MTADHVHAPARVVVVGLGPGNPRHVTTETLDVIAQIPHRFLRTSRHPSAHLVGDAATFDALYESAERFDDVYVEIADQIIAAAAEHGEVLYAVPGSPLILERSVRYLREREHDNAALAVDVLAAMSFIDLVWDRLGIDPVEAGVRLIDGHDFAAAAGDAGPLLVAHTHANWVLSDIKLAVEQAAGDEPVTLLRALGTEEEEVVTTTWADMDRTIEADHLTSLYIPKLAEPVGQGYVRFHELARTLREQCPWDIEQTHQSLIPYLIEETYEVVDALQALDPDDPSTDTDVIEELGDLLYQIEFHATIAEQQGRFTINDVTDGIHDKLVRRHPHVFGDVTATDTEAVASNWDQIKAQEKDRTSVFDGVARSLPSLSYAAKVSKRAAKIGFDWPDTAGAFPKISEETNELHEAIVDDDDTAIADELGDLLFAVVNVARHVHVDPELALRSASDKFRRRFEALELIAVERGIEIPTAGLDALDELWREVKAAERAR